MPPRLLSIVDNLKFDNPAMLVKRCSSNHAHTNAIPDQCSAASLRDVYGDTETDRACLRAWHRSLRPGGLLVIETRDTVRVAAIDESERHLQREDGVFVRVTGIMTEYIKTDWATNVMTIDYRLGAQRFVSRTRLYHRDEIVRMLQEEGFHDIRICRDLDLHSVEPARHTVFLARA